MTTRIAAHALMIALGVVGVHQEAFAAEGFGAVMQTAPAPRALPAPTPAPSAQPGQKVEPPAASAPANSRRRNVSIEVAISDQGGSGSPVEKIVTMMIADGLAGSVRTGSAETPSVINTRAVTLNVDATPRVSPDESILLALTLEYRPAADGRDEAGGLQLNERLSVTLESGRPLVVSRAVDPSGSRRVAVKVTATVMK